MISLRIFRSVLKVLETVSLTFEISNSKCILFIIQHQATFYFKSKTN